MKNLIFLSMLFLALAGCSGMLAGDGYSNFDPGYDGTGFGGYSGFEGMGYGGFGGMDDD